MTTTQSIGQGTKLLAELACGHVWRARKPTPIQPWPWGFAWEVIAPYADEPTASGWAPLQETAEARMQNALERHRA